MSEIRRIDGGTFRIDSVSKQDAMGNPIAPYRNHETNNGVPTGPEKTNIPRAPKKPKNELFIKPGEIANLLI